VTGSDGSRLVRVVPGGPEEAPLTDADLLATLSPRDRSRPCLRVNFVTTLDGASTSDGVSGSLGGPADGRVFDLLRRVADVVVVGAGTVRDEGYGAMRLSEDAATWREQAGLAPQPVFALVSGSLRLDPESTVFTEAPVRPLVLTTDRADPGARRALERVADVVACGDERVDPHLLRDALVERGLPQMHCEGGPRLFGDLVRADAVDELFLTLAPLLEGGHGLRVSQGSDGDDSSPLRRMRLAHVLRDGDELLTWYVRDRAQTA